MYPPSLYRAVSYVSTLGVPVYILENGMPAKQDDERRTEWIDGCMAEVFAQLDICCPARNCPCTMAANVFAIAALLQCECAACHPGRGGIFDVLRDIGRNDCCELIVSQSTQV